MDNLHNRLCELHLTPNEATVYLALLQKTTSHLELARHTGINRTKVYRIVDELEKRCLVCKRTDDRGTFIVAVEPTALEIHQIAYEEDVRYRRSVLGALIPDLMRIQRDAGSNFAVYTCEGTKGFKQMVWHELRAEGELFAFGNATIERLIGGDRRWAEKFRMLVAREHYTIRHIVNKTGLTVATQHDDYSRRYKSLVVLEDDLPMDVHFIVYNDTVSFYQLEDERRVGVEIINAKFANTMRHVFEHYWQIGRENR